MHCPLDLGPIVTISEYSDGRLNKEYLAATECPDAQHVRWLFQGLVILNADCVGNRWLVWRANEAKGRAVSVKPERREGVLFLSGPSRLQFRIRNVERATPWSRQVGLKWPVRSRRVDRVKDEIPKNGRFGAHRTGGRFHTGVDVPALSDEEILSPIDGQVIMISYLKTQLTIFLKRSREGGEDIVAIAHLKEPVVKIGQSVDTETTMARAMNLAELARTRHSYNHVHLEVRKSIADLGSASIDTSTRARLDRMFLDPLTFLETEK